MWSIFYEMNNVLAHGIMYRFFLLCSLYCIISLLWWCYTFISNHDIVFHYIIRILMIKFIQRCVSVCLLANPIWQTLVANHVWWILYKLYMCVKWTVTSYRHVVFHETTSYSVYSGSLGVGFHSINMTCIQAIRSESQSVMKFDC